MVQDNYLCWNFNKKLDDKQKKYTGKGYANPLFY
jgi:hypothetical protein